MILDCVKSIVNNVKSSQFIYIYDSLAGQLSFIVFETVEFQKSEKLVITWSSNIPIYSLKYDSCKHIQRLQSLFSIFDVLKSEDCIFFRKFLKNCLQYSDLEVFFIKVLED